MMLVLLNEISGKNSGLAECLACYSNVSIFLSVSQEDTLRILREVKPDVAIFRKSYAVESSSVRELSIGYPEIAFYVFDNEAKVNSETELENYRDHSYLTVQSVIFPENQTTQNTEAVQHRKSITKPRSGK